MKSRKGIVFSAAFILEFLLALFFFFLIASIFSKSLHGFIFRNEDTKAFNSFIEDIKALQVNEDEAFIFPYLKETGALLFIPKQKNQFVLNAIALENSENTLLYGKSIHQIFFVIPETCKTSACMCLCRNDFSLVDDQTNYLPCNQFTWDCIRVECKGKMKCERFDNLDFRPVTSFKTLYPGYPREVSEQFMNGFFIRKSSNADSSFSSYYLPPINPDTQTWHMRRNAGNILDMCLGEGCLPQIDDSNKAANPVNAETQSQSI